MVRIEPAALSGHRRQRAYAAHSAYAAEDTTSKPLCATLKAAHIGGFAVAMVRDPAALSSWRRAASRQRGTVHPRFALVAPSPAIYERR
jgi:hypothetical protein